MLRLRLLLFAIALAIVATSCSAVATLTPTAFTATTEPETAAASASQATSDEFDEVAYCEALTEMFEAEPDGVVVDGDFAAYEATIDAAAEVAPADHREPLEALGELIRFPDDITFENMAAVGERLLPVSTFAEDRCGIVDDSAGTSTRFEISSSPGPISITLEDVAGTSDDSPALMIFSGPGSEPPRPIPTSTDPGSLAAAVNSQVPERSDLVFAWQQVAEEGEPEYSSNVLAPVGWAVDVSTFGVSFEDFPLGELEISAGCQGICAPQDWLEIMDDPQSSPFATFEDEDNQLILRQELTEPAGRLIVHSRTGSFGGVFVNLTRWSNEADKFFLCEVELDTDAAELWPVFADACIAADPIWF